ncbi:MAG: MFS transporter [Acidobacteria bacterium]|nr:MFS transporter [Acidobacteriota bacterium]
MTRRATEAAAFGGMFLFGIVVALLGAVLPLVSAPLDLGLDAVGNLFLALNGAILAGSPLFGIVVDRFGYRGALTGGPLLIGTALVLVSGAGTAWELAGAVALLGLGGSALNSATNALVADLHPEPRVKAAALNRLGVFFGLGALLLPFLIGTLLDRLGLGPLLLGAAVLSVLTGVFSALPSYPPAKQPEGLSLADARAVLRHPLVAILGALLFFQAGTEMLLSGYLTTFLTSDTGASVRAASLVLSGFWVALITARMLLGRVLLHVSALALVPLMAGGAALSLALATLAPGFAAASALLLVAAFALAGVTPTVLGVAATALPARTGTVFGLLFSFSVTGAMTVPWAAGHLAEAHDVRIVLDIGASGFAVVTLLALRARHLGRAG